MNKTSKRNHIIRKTENSFSVSSGNNWIGSFVFFLFGLPLLFLAICGVINGNYSIIEAGGGFLIGLMFTIVGIWILKTGMKEKRAKELPEDFKKTGFGIMKKVKITSFEHYGNDCIYLEAKEGNMIYCSNTFRGGEVIGGVPEIEWFEEVYKDYGFEYDETHKDDVLRAIDKRISEQEYILQNAGFFKRIGAKMMLSAAEAAKQFVEMGYTPPQLEINGHTVSIGDTVNVHIDPKDEKNYWMDIDFLFNEKYHLEN